MAGKEFSQAGGSSSTDTDPLNGLTTQAYEAFDRLICTTDAARTGLTDYGSTTPTT